MERLVVTDLNKPTKYCSLFCFSWFDSTPLERIQTCYLQTSSIHPLLTDYLQCCFFNNLLPAAVLDLQATQYMFSSVWTAILAWLQTTLGVLFEAGGLHKMTYRDPFQPWISFNSEFVKTQSLFFSFPLSCCFDVLDLLWVISLLLRLFSSHSAQHVASTVVNKVLQGCQKNHVACEVLESSYNDLWDSVHFRPICQWWKPYLRGCLYSSG